MQLDDSKNTTSSCYGCVVKLTIGYNIQYQQSRVHDLHVVVFLEHVLWIYEMIYELFSVTLLRFIILKYITLHDVTMVEEYIHLENKLQKTLDD